MGNLQSPKEALLAALARSEVDPDQVLELATQLAQTSDRVRFSVDAGIINRLGRELVTRKEIAVAELIKNAYDADATQVTLTFQDTEPLHTDSECPECQTFWRSDAEVADA